MANKKISKKVFKEGTKGSFNSTNSTLPSTSFANPTDGFYDFNTLVREAVADSSGIGASISLADGTVALPSLTFDSDANTGIYWIAADNIGITTGGTKIVDVASIGVAITGTLSSTGAAIISGTLNYKAQVTDTGGAYATPVVLTTAQSGRLILVDDAAGLDFTLPAIAAADVGTWFEFLVTVSITSNNFRVTAGAADLLNGGVLAIDFDAAYTAPQAAFFEPDFSDDLVMTCNGGTTGGKKGTRIKFEAVSATQWFVTGTLVGDGVLATPFS